MRARFAPLLAAVLLGTAADARAQLPPLPVPVPPVPQLPVPLPPAAPVPVVPPPAPAPPPAPPPPPAPVPDVSATVGSVVQGVAGAVGLGPTTGATGSTSSPASTPKRPRTKRIRATKPGIRNSGARGERRAAILNFSLSRAAVVRIRIRRESPDCVVIGTLALRGRPGSNRVRFGGRYKGVALAPGTYSLTANALRGGRYVSLGRTRVVVVPAGGDVEAARPARSTCGSGGSGGTASAAASGSGSVAVASGRDDDDGDVQGRESEDISGAAAGGRSGGPSGSGTAGAEAAGASGGAPRDGRILGVVANPFESAPAWLQPVLLLALGLAILALLAAALPAAAIRPVGVAPTVDRRRTELALAGALALGVVAVAALVL